MMSKFRTVCNYRAIFVLAFGWAAPLLMQNEDIGQSLLERNDWISEFHFLFYQKINVDVAKMVIFVTAAIVWSIYESICVNSLYLQVKNEALIATTEEKKLEELQHSSKESELFLKKELKATDSIA